MSKKTRKILFYSSIAIFLILSTIIVLFALGYGYDFRHGLIVKTGGFGITTNTSATVYIDRKLVGGTSFLSDFYSKSRLLPRSYQVRVEAEKFRSWQKAIKIEEGVFADFPSVVLLPQEPKQEVLASKSWPNAVDELYFYKDNFYFLNNHQLNAYKPTNQKQELLLKKVETFSIDDDSIIYRTADKTWHSYSLDNKTSQPLQILPTPSPRLSSFPSSSPNKTPAPSLSPAVLVSVTIDPKTVEQFQDIDGNKYIIARSGKQAGLYLFHNAEVKKLADDVLGFQISPDGGKLAYFNSHEIHVLYLRQTNRQPYKIAGQDDLLLRTGQNINDIQWYKDSEHLFFNADDTVSFMEIDNRDKLNSFDLATSVRSFFYDRSADVLYTSSFAGLTKFGLR